MKKMPCQQSNCFYYAKGQCTSITAMGGEDCAQFRSKTHARALALPRRLDLAMTRWHLDRAFQADQRVSTASRKLCALEKDQALYATG